MTVGKPAVAMKELIVILFCVISAHCLKLKNVERAIDLGSQLARISNTLTIENDDSSNLQKFLFYIEPKQASHLSFIGTSTGLNVKPATSSSAPIGAKTFEVTLKDPIRPGKSAKVKVETVFAESIVPFPKEITQREKHLVKYTGNLYLYSEYDVTSQTTKISVPPGTTEGYTKIKPVTYSDNVVSYGPFESIKSFTEEELFVHYENSKTFLTVTSLLRTIELSHWGNIAIEETVDVLHTGAKLKGSFSRFDFQREGASANVVKKFKTVLPAAAKDIYYRDHIGNISTSNVRVQKESVEAELRPRFPLFGGWKTHYVLGYNVPSYEYLYRNGEFYTLKLRLLDHIFDNVFVKNLEIQVILPEGVTDIEVSTPYDVKRLEDRLHYTFLDIGGRPVITFLAQNLVDEHIQDFEVRYRFNRIFMLREIVMCIVAFFLLYLSVIIYSYLDFSLNKHAQKHQTLQRTGPLPNSPKGSGSSPVTSITYLRHLLILPTKFHPDLSTLSVFQDFRPSR
nr:EOG090X04O4 [Artemia franciscana]